MEQTAKIDHHENFLRELFLTWKFPYLRKLECQNRLFSKPSTCEKIVTYLPAVFVVPSTGSSPTVKGGRILYV